MARRGPHRAAGRPSCLAHLRPEFPASAVLHDRERNVFDRDSIMTYETECADVTGERFGSRNLDEWDQKGVKAVYPKVAQRDNDVGVIPAVRGSCPEPTEVKIYTDNEDTRQQQPVLGLDRRDRQWPKHRLRILQDRRQETRAATGTGRGQREIRGAEARRNTCPRGSTEFERYTDDEDGHRPRTSAGWPVRSGRPARTSVAGTGTELHWCMFERWAAERGLRCMYSFPDLGFRYGVVAAPSLSRAAQTG